MQRDARLTPWRFVLLFGVVSLLTDMVYEGARSINGPFLATLGASAFVVGMVAGIGDFLCRSLVITALLLEPGASPRRSRSHGCGGAVVRWCRYSGSTVNLPPSSTSSTPAPLPSGSTA